MEKIFELKIAAYYKNIKIIKNLTEATLDLFEFDSNTNYMLKLAVAEASANIIEHAYKKEVDKDIIYTIEQYDDKLVFIFRDFGIKTDIKDIKSRELEEYEENGLGVFLITSIMDDVNYFQLEDGTRLELTKYFSGDVNNE
ncbi:ATP-binding protein [Haliovirga abyssi]|uniref:Histidine kinase/HSP90-like ATPase domain-containing protein n=1 Tax=Haliovirga abyssi TaxID=2996794 RepID=A0AAU9DCW9_9FUSO|nr:ATP-binding protein [Haliovirga abyssi]BDU50147.1 hypothetical protein HLVA_07160 [Haliovirga abyssi]